MIYNELTPTMKKVLLLLREAPKTDSELFTIIPNFSKELLGKLRSLEMIDHHGYSVYLTGYGENIVEKFEKQDI